MLLIHRITEDFTPTTTLTHAHSRLVDRETTQKMEEGNKENKQAARESVVIGDGRSSGKRARWASCQNTRHSRSEIAGIGALTTLLGGRFKNLTDDADIAAAVDRRRSAVFAIVREQRDRVGRIQQFLQKTFGDSRTVRSTARAHRRKSKAVTVDRFVQASGTLLVDTDIHKRRNKS